MRINGTAGRDRARKCVGGSLLNQFDLLWVLNNNFRPLFVELDRAGCPNLLAIEVFRRIANPRLLEFLLRRPWG
jgi:hypothetical protein